MCDGRNISMRGLELSRLEMHVSSRGAPIVRRGALLTCVLSQRDAVLRHAEVNRNKSRNHRNVHTKKSTLQRDAIAGTGLTAQATAENPKWHTPRRRAAQERVSTTQEREHTTSNQKLDQETSKAHMGIENINPPTHAKHAVWCDKET